MTTEKINDFLEEYGTEIQPNDNVELMMDDHKCIEFQGTVYYIPENSSLWSDEDEEVYDYLLELKEIIKIAENGFDFNE